MSEDRPHGTESRTQLEGRHQAARQELQELRQKMDVIKQEVADEVDRNWTSMWRTDEMFDLKVSATLSSNDEYRSLLGQVQDAERAEAALAEELGHTGEDESA